MVTFANSPGLSTRQDAMGVGRWSPNLIVGRVTLTIVLLGLLSVAEYLLLFRLGFQVPSPPIYLAGVVVVATLLGPGYGIIFALCSILLRQALFDNQPFSLLTALEENVSSAFIFVSVAMLVGTYADFLKEKLRTAPPLERSDHIAQSLDHVLAPEEPASGRQWKREAQNIAIAILMIASAGIFTAGLYFIFGIQRSLSFFVAGVLITAITRGTRPSMVAAILAVLASNVLSGGLHFSIAITMGDLVNLVTLSSVAWWVGNYADDVRHGKRMARTLFDASQMLSTLNDEIAIRRILVSAVAEVCGSSSVWISDERGEFLKGKGSPPFSRDTSIGSAIGYPTPGKRSPWRVQTMRVDDRPLGFLTFACRPGRQSLVVDRVVTVLADLGANAIVRARLTAEQIDMQMVAQAEKLRTALLSSISHDFRTPLSGILGAASGLLEQGDSYDRIRQHDLLLNIRNQAIRLNRYIENLLSMMQFESGALKVRAQLLLVEPLVYDAWEALGDSGGSLRILEVRIQDDALVFADQFLFTQVLTNLFENAIKHTPKGSTVIVRGRTSGRSQLIEIVDSGSGVTEGDLPQIFNRFYRGEQPTSVGLGLGLYITRALLEAMKASIEVRNRADGKSGLVVSMVLPARESQ